jgi:hypothetical protein
MSFTVGARLSDEHVDMLCNIEPGHNKINFQSARGADYVVSTRAASLSELRTELIRAGIEQNPGPPKSKGKPQAQKQQPKKPAPIAKQPKNTAQRLGRLIPKGTFATIGALGGSAVGGAFGVPGFGATVGGLVGRGAARLTGMGDYTLNSNTVLDGTAVPRMTSGTHGFRVTHKEFIKDVVGSNKFASETFTVTPANHTCFPWLSNLAKSFCRYEFHGLVFTYVPTSGNLSTTGALGTVVLATQYDSQASTWDDKAEMEQSRFATSTVPSTGTMHGIECDPSLRAVKMKYTNTERAGPAELAVWCKTQMATVGMPSAYTVGELWVSYDVTFYEPKPVSQFAQSFYRTQSTTSTAAGYTQGSAATTDVLYEYNVGAPFVTTGPDNHHVTILESGIMRYTVTAYCATNQLNAMNIFAGVALNSGASNSTTHTYVNGDSGIMTGYTRVKAGDTISWNVGWGAACITVDAIELTMVLEDGFDFTDLSQNLGPPVLSS